MKKSFILAILGILFFYGCADDQTNTVDKEQQDKGIEIIVMSNDKEMGKVKLNSFAESDLVDQGEGDSKEKAVAVSKIISKASGDAGLVGEKLQSYLKQYYCDYEGKDDKGPFRPSSKSKPDCRPYNCEKSEKIYIGVKTGAFYPKQVSQAGCYAIKGVMTHVHVMTKEFWGKEVNE